ncbi:MAG: hypothetical protein IM638_15045 [Bacteroidetes bacterium]|nr:hypothetical protein [Bacteroidota bacterium]
MKGISFIIDEKNRKKSVVIDLRTIAKHEEEVYELIDTLIAESRQGGEVIAWESAKKQLNRKK